MNEDEEAAYIQHTATIAAILMRGYSAAVEGMDAQHRLGVAVRLSDLVMAEAARLSAEIEDEEKANP